MGARGTMKKIFPLREVPACLSRPNGVAGELHNITAWLINSLIIITTLIFKIPPTSLCQREVLPLFGKEG
jgi:hypothetical protein